MLSERFVEHDAAVLEFGAWMKYAIGFGFFGSRISQMRTPALNHEMLTIFP